MERRQLSWQRGFRLDLLFNLGFADTVAICKPAFTFAFITLGGQMLEQILVL